jgi:cell division control protein 6
VFDDADTSDLLADATYLSDEYDPEEPVGREEEVDQIVAALQPLVDHQTPDSLLVHGPAGVGKSTCVEYVFDHLDAETRVKTVSLNCWQYNTRSALLTQLLIEVGYPAPRKGKPVDELLGKLREWLDKNRRLAIMLDEFDQLDAQSEIVYDLHLLQEEADNELGLVLVSNQPPSALDLDARSESRLSIQTLEFESYTAEQIRAILEDRLPHAFVSPRVVSEDVLDEIASQAAGKDGDCRQALRRLQQAARRAQIEDSDKIQRLHLGEK